MGFEPIGSLWHLTWYLVRMCLSHKDS
jgi:hypothetical protein